MLEEGGHGVSPSIAPKVEDVKRGHDLNGMPVSLCGGWGTRTYTIITGSGGAHAGGLLSPYARSSVYLEAWAELNDWAVGGANEGYNESPSEEGSFPGTGERVGGSELQLDWTRCRTARTETGIPPTGLEA